MQKLFAKRCIISLILVICLIAFALLMCLVPTSSASADMQPTNNDLNIEYDGNVKILSNIENYLSKGNSTKARSISNGNLYNVLSQMGYANNINCLDEDFIDSVERTKHV